MAQRDYVKKKAKPKTKSRVMPKLIMALAVLLVMLFSAILYFVSSNKPTTNIASQQNTTEKPQQSLPDKPEERYTYLKQLENPDDNQPIQSSLNNKNKQSENRIERQTILDSFAKDKPNNNPTTVLPPTTGTQQVITQTDNNPSSNNWLLQCGAFKDKANAESLNAKLAILGITSKIKSERFFRVISGPYKTKVEAEKTVINLKGNGITCSITAIK